MEDKVSRQRYIIAAVGLVALAFVGCTSVGHEVREIPKLAKPTERITEIGFDPDDNALAAAIEQYLTTRGVKVTLLDTPRVRERRADKEYAYGEVQTRYVLSVSSDDLDRCVPEGSRQMNFSITVVDYQSRQRLFIMNGHHGCLDSILKQFDRWFTASNPAK